LIEGPSLLRVPETFRPQVTSCAVRTGHGPCPNRADPAEVSIALRLVLSIEGVEYRRA
jgi:hypothetical protein